MSSGKIEGNFLKNFQNDLLFDESAVFTDFFLQKSLQAKSKLFINEFKTDLSFKIEQNNERHIDIFFKTIKNIHLFLSNSTDLTQKQKFDYCNSQRLFMKLYLQRISKKLGV